MANIQPFIDAINDAVYGEEVRGAIRDAISAINDENREVVQGSVVQAIEDAVGTDIKSFIEDFLSQRLSDSVVKIGWIQGKAVINKNSYGEVRSPIITVPSGYTLMGLSSASQDHLNACYMTAFGVDKNNNHCYAWFHNDASVDLETTVGFTYFCIRTS